VAYLDVSSKVPKAEVMSGNLKKGKINIDNLVCLKYLINTNSNVTKHLVCFFGK
jgi:hypothetical protein